MIELKQHPTLKDLIPPLSKEEYQALKQDIQEHGIQVPIIHDAAGQIIDGWNRYLIAKELEIEAKTVEWEFPDNVERGISLNLRRRHLSKDQRDKLILALREKGWTIQKVAETVGVSVGTVSQKGSSNFKNENARPTDQRRKITPKEEEEIKEETKTEPQKEVAKKHKVSKQRVSQIVKKEKKKKLEGKALIKELEQSSKKMRLKTSRADSPGLKILKVAWKKANNTDREMFLNWVSIQRKEKK